MLFKSSHTVRFWFIKQLHLCFHRHVSLQTAMATSNCRKYQLAFTYIHLGVLHYHAARPRWIHQNKNDAEGHQGTRESGELSSPMLAKDTELRIVDLPRGQEVGELFLLAIYSTPYIILLFCSNLPSTRPCVIHAQTSLRFLRTVPHLHMRYMISPL